MVLAVVVFVEVALPSVVELALVVVVAAVVVVVAVVVASVAFAAF